MATNEILQFAETDTGTNLLTQAEYLADSQRPIGNQPGVARSKLVNKALRQASLISAGVAEFLAGNQANNIIDGLTPQDIAAYMEAVVRSLGIPTAVAGGTADAITADFTPNVALTNGTTVIVRAGSANATTTPTFAPDGLAAKTIVKGNNLALVAGDIAGAGHWLEMNFDAVLDKWVLQNPAYGVIAINPVNPTIRQTVLSGPVDTNGFSAFGGSAESTTVTAAGTLKPTAAFGIDNRVGSIANPSWTGLSTNGTMYLYLDIASDGTCIPGSTTLAPVYQWGGTYSTTSGQNTFNIQEMTMKVGNGASASQVWRVFVGEVTVAGGVVTAIVWYALMGRYDSGYIANLPGLYTQTSKNHNLGLAPSLQAFLMVKCLVAEHNYSVGDEVTELYTAPGGTQFTPIGISSSRNSCSFTTGQAAVYSINKTTGALAVLTQASWAYRLFLQRGW